jgi:acylphosphatase
MSDKTVIATIKGRVQGVNYRFWTEQMANRLGLAGWVRNARDGSVEALFSGKAEDVEVMLSACRTGPRTASVADIKVVDIEESDIPSPFEIRY